MNFKNLGNTDIKVSTICLGTMTWGEQNTELEAFEQMDFALDQGVNFWDTAELYAVPPKKETYGDTEEIIGKWFEKTKKRDKVILATKVAGPARDYLRSGENSFTGPNLESALNDSLKRLKTDYIDLYQLHWPERNTNFFGKHGYEHDENDNDWTPFEEILESLKKFISFPVSNLEKTEKLEQLRALENGMIIKVVKTKDHFIGVDTQKDLNKVRNKIKNQSESN